MLISITKVVVRHLRLCLVTLDSSQIVDYQNITFHCHYGIDKKCNSDQNN